MRLRLAAPAMALVLTFAGAAQAGAATLKEIVRDCSPRNGWCGWQRTVDCENHGRWYETPGQFFYGVQFAWGSLATSQAHTGVRVSAWPPSQIVNAIWLRDNSRADPWPNCPNPT